MDSITEAHLEQLLNPYFIAPVLAGESSGAPATQLPLEEIVVKLRVYLDLLLRWNQRTNLTAIRSPAEIVARHLGESLFAARVLAHHVEDGNTALDIGSGAGFPGLPLQLLLPKLKVTLAESQGKKSAFLREAVRATEAGAEIWAARAEALPQDRHFDVVMMRAVDNPRQAAKEGGRRVKLGGWLLQMTGAQTGDVEESEECHICPIPGLQSGFVNLSRTRGV